MENFENSKNQLFYCYLRYVLSDTYIFSFIVLESGIGLIYFNVCSKAQLRSLTLLGCLLSFLLNLICSRKHWTTLKRK